MAWAVIRVSYAVLLRCCSLIRPTSLCRQTFTDNISGRHAACILLQINHVAGSRINILLLGLDDDEVLRKSCTDLLAHDIRHPARVDLKVMYAGSEIMSRFTRFWCDGIQVHYGNALASLAIAPPCIGDGGAHFRLDQGRRRERGNLPTIHTGFCWE